MYKKAHSRTSVQDRYSVSSTAAIVLTALTALITPQIILRAFDFGRADSTLYLALSVGVVVFALVMWVLGIVNRVSPRRSSHQIATRFLGTWAGLMVGAARILMYGMLVLLGVELVVTVISSVTPFSGFEQPISAVLVLVFSLFALINRNGSALRWPRVFAWLGILGLLAVLGYGLFMEFMGWVEFSDLLLAQEDAFQFDIVRGRYFPRIESVLGTCFPASILFLLSERAMEKPERRRVPIRRIAQGAIPMMVLIGLTVYLMVKLKLPGRRLGLPALSSAYGLFGAEGRIIVGVLFALVGIAMAGAAYRSLPRVLRELALDGLLPQRLAAEDEARPRRMIVFVMAVLGASISLVMDSARALAMIFVVQAFFMGFILAAAQISRSRGILQDSTSAEERKEARSLAWIFRAFMIVCAVLIIFVAIVQPYWVVWAAICLIVPVGFLAIYRRELGKVNRALAVDPNASGRLLPIRVHSFVLVDYVDQPTLRALDWARASRGATVQGVCVDIDPARTRLVRDQWKALKLPIALTVIGTPKGALRGPVIEYIRGFLRTHPHDVAMVYVPRVISSGAIERFALWHHTPRMLTELELEPRVMVTHVPFVLDENEDATDDE